MRLGLRILGLRQTRVRAGARLRVLRTGVILHPKMQLNPLTTNDDYNRHRNSAACYQLAQSVLKIGSEQKGWDGWRWVGHRPG